MYRHGSGHRRHRSWLAGPLVALAVAGAAITAPSAAAPLAAGGRQSPAACRTGTVPGDGGCTSSEGPESLQDQASLQGQLDAREVAPFSSAPAGAYRAAVAAAGTVPGSGGAWTPAAATPDCDGHTSDSTVCPLVDNTSMAESNGDYTISVLGHKELSGRITALAGDPANANRVFAAPAFGGVFETTNGGMTWHSIGERLPTQVMGALAYDAPLHRLLAGTGDNSFGGSATQGLGIFTSDNDGATWNVTAGLPDTSFLFRIVVSPADPSGRTVYAATSRGLFRSPDGGAHWANLALPTSPAGYTVPDPTRRGAQVSCAGNTTAPLCFFANMVTDVVVKRSGSANAPAGAVMAVVGWRGGDAADTNPDGSDNTACRLKGAPTACIQAPHNGLYLSTTGAPGSFRFQSHAGSPLGTDFAPDAVVGRTSLGIADGAGQNNDAVFALVQDAQKLQHCTDDVVDTDVVSVCQPEVQSLGVGTVLDGAYATYDFGKSWTKIMNWSQLAKASGALAGEAGYSPGVQSWYNNWIKPDPTATDSKGDPTRVLFGLEEIWENNVSVPGVLSTPWVANPGISAAAPWVDIGRYWNDCLALSATGGVPCDLSGPPNVTGTTTTHPDQHAYLFVPDGHGGVTFYAGSDGGAYKQHVAAGGNFSNQSWGDGIDVGLNTLQPYDAEVSRDGTIVAGLQDNGETKIAPGGKEEHTVFGGDGFFTMIDPNNSNHIVEEYTYGAPSLSLDGGKDWYNIDSGLCGGNEALFSTPLELDPATPGHAVEGCTQILEAGDGATTDLSGTSTTAPIWANPCAVPPGGDPFQCQATNTPWTPVYDLGVASAPGQPVDRSVQCAEPQGVNVNGCVFNIPSAVGVRGANVYVGYCGYCDVLTGGVPFNSGIATNVGGDAPPKPGTGNGWHIAHAACSSCGAPNGLLPKRYITSIQVDPGDPRTVYVTMGGYGRHWIPPGALGDSVTNVGVGHVFVSHDAGEHFSDISGNLPDIPANWSIVRRGQLIVATDLGVYAAPTTGGARWSHLGVGLPNIPVLTVRLQPGNPSHLIAATYGRGVYQYWFPAAHAAAAAAAHATTTLRPALLPLATGRASSAGGGTAPVTPSQTRRAAPVALVRTGGALAGGARLLLLLVAVPLRRRRRAQVAP